MASNHIPNYNLNQWQATDRVILTEFNEDNAKIDAALAGLQAGQHQICMGSYRSNNTDTVTLELPFQLQFLYIQKAHLEDVRYLMVGDKATLTYWLSDKPWCIPLNSGHTLTMNGTTVTITVTNSSARTVLNTNVDYLYIAIG